MKIIMNYIEKNVIVMTQIFDIEVETR